jgi:TctA family transporter
MEFLSHLALGFGVAFTPLNLLYALVGCLLGTLIGVLPGIGPVATIAMLLPITYGVPTVSALIMLAGIYYGAQYGGSTTSILVNLPGEASSAVTCLDGYQMARKGRAGAALCIAALGSFFAGCVGTMLLAAFAAPMTELALKFGPAEYFSLMMLGMIGAVVLAHGSLLKAVGMIVLGLLFGIVGTDVNSGMARFSFGVPELTDGIGTAQIAVGVFGFAEILMSLSRQESRDILQQKLTSLMPNREETRRAVPAVVRGTAIGSVLGVLPGGGALLASFAAYGLEKKVSRRPQEFGTGAVEGVAGPESANNAAAQTSFIPLLTLGIPPNAVMALMVGAMTIHNIQPGPQVMTSNPGLFLGADRQHVDRQPDAGCAQSSPDRHVGQAAHGAVSPPLPRHPALLLHRRVQHLQQRGGRLPHGAVRLHGLCICQARMRARAAAPRLRARAAAGREPPARDAALAWRSDGLLHPAAFA